MDVGVRKEVSTEVGFGVWWRHGKGDQQEGGGGSHKVRKNAKKGERKPPKRKGVEPLRKEGEAAASAQGKTLAERDQKREA